mmetsp:Transcript_1823/g.2151  ORF Transcript_1823/g.2151 Transcript_1823/m.2151 type:complete len:187 (-) Transcript_1823:128-688(-)
MDDSFSIAISQEFYAKKAYLQTASGTKVSKNSKVLGSQNIHITGNSIIREGVMLRGDLALMRLGKFVTIKENTVLHPPTRRSKGMLAYYPISIGDYVVIGRDCVISAAQIGSNVIVGDGCIIGKRCIIKDNAIVLPGSVLPPDTNVAPFTSVGGCPGMFLGELPESTHIVNKEKAKAVYLNFVQAN